MRSAVLLMAMAAVAFAGAGIDNSAAGDFDETKVATLKTVLERGKP
jgi:hypothetical protein